MVNEKAASASLIELGLRHYNFAKGWGGSGIAGYLKPAYVAAGAAVVPGSPGTLNPFAGEEHWGAFLSWGDLKVAWVKEPTSRLLVSKQMQFIRNLF